MRAIGPTLVALLSLTLAIAVLAGGCTEERTRPAAENAPSRAQAPKAPGQAGSNPSRSGTRRGQSRVRDRSIGISQDSGSGVSSASFSSSPGDTQTASSTGVATLHFDVERPSRLTWTNTKGKPFSARGGGVSIDSRRGRGEANLRPGRYENFYVSGAAWKIAVRPR